MPFTNTYALTTATATTTVSLLYLLRTALLFRQLFLWFAFINNILEEKRERARALERNKKEREKE